MSERGVFALDRGWFDHPSFAAEPFTEREAWAWLISEAAFKDRIKRIGSIVLSLERGQVAASLRFMADKWSWKEPRVRRFLGRLKIDAMLTVATDAGISVITICNYTKYQRVSLPKDAVTDAQNDAATTQQRRKVEGTEDIETGSEANASGAGAPADDPSEPEREYFARGRKVLGKSAGGQLAKLLKANGGNVSLSRSTLELAATKFNPAEFFARAIAPNAQGPPPGRGGFTSVLMDKHQERQNGTSDSEPEFYEH